MNIIITKAVPSDAEEILQFLNTIYKEALQISLEVWHADSVFTD